MKQIKIILFLLLSFLLILNSCSGAVTFSGDEKVLMSVYDEEINEEEEEKMTNRVAVFDTSLGEFKLELFEEKMPITTGNFIKLAEEGFYDGTSVHRVIAKFMIQGDDHL